MQINRLFEIVYILLQRNVTTAKYLSSHFQVSTRTIYRDVDTLSSAGIPIYMTQGKGGGISLLPNFVLDQAILTTAEKNNILSSLNALRSIHPDVSDTALQKLNSLFGKSYTDWVEVDFMSWSSNPNDQITFSILKQSVIDRKIISFNYTDIKNSTSHRKVEPLKLCYKEHSWYIYAYCLYRNDFRFFKLRRIKNLTVLNEYFSRNPPSQVFVSQDIFSDEFTKIKLKLSQEMAFRVYDEFDTFHQLDDGSFIVEVNYPIGDWVFYFISSFGEHCTVLEPKHLADTIILKLQSTLKNYL